MLPPRGSLEQSNLLSAAASKPLDGVIVPFIKFDFLILVGINENC